MLSALLIASCFALSLGQTTDCINTYNATLSSSATDNGTCAGSLYSFFLGSPGPDSAETTSVCQQGQDCNSRLENIVSVCGDSIDFPNRTTLDLLCSFNHNGTSCLSIFSSISSDEDDENSFFNDVFNDCGSGFLSGTCSAECMQGWQEVNDTLGCCFPSGLQAGVDSGETTYDQFLLLAGAIPRSCGFTAQFCNGTEVPQSMCEMGHMAVFGPGDACSVVVAGLFADDFPNIADLYAGDCPTLLQSFATGCSSIIGNEFVEIARGIMEFSQAMTDDGTSCTDYVSTFFSLVFSEDDDGEFVCLTDYKYGLCSDECKMILMNLTASFGCCFNSFFATTTGEGDDVTDHIDYAILTREIYSACNVESSGFCDGITPPSISNEASRCINTGDSFFSNTNAECLDYFRTLGRVTSSDAVNEAALQVCNGGCRRYLNNYVNYLTVCRLGDDDDDDNDDDDDDEDDDYLELPYITGNTTCRVNQANHSCYTVINTNAAITAVGAAFDDDGDCLSIFVTGDCSTACRTILQAAMVSTGCCLTEYGRAALDPSRVDTISQSCDIQDLNTRCMPIGGGGADTVKGLGLFTLLLYGVLVMFMY